MEPTYSPRKVQLCHQALHFTALFSGLLHHHLPVGHLWADLLKRTLAKERLILQVSPSAAPGIWWWQLVQKSKTVTNTSQLQVGKCNKNCFSLLSWSHTVKGKDHLILDHTLSNLLHFSIGAFLRLISIFTVTNPGQINRDTAFCS